MYKLHISVKAGKQIKQIKRSKQTAIILALEEIREDPLQGKPLSRELTGRFSCRVGVYRIIYKIDQKDQVIDILSAGHRANIYK